MKKNGFTLVELLAVIAILAILVIIALPNVLKMFNQAKKDTFLTESKNIYKEISKKYITETMRGNKINNISNNNNKLDLESNNLKYNIKLNDDGSIKNFEVSNGTYCISGKFNNLSELTTDKITEGECEVKEPKNFSTDSWETIVEAVQEGNTSKYNVGDTKEVELNGYGKHTLRIANKSTPDECKKDGFSQTACGFVLEFVDIITKNVMNDINTNAGGWPDSKLYTFVNTNIYNSLPSKLKNATIDTLTVSGLRDMGSHYFFTSIDKLYLLAVEEVCIDCNYVPVNNLTRMLDYYENIGATTNKQSAFIKKHENNNSSWWLRWAQSGNSSRFNAVDSSGYFISNEPRSVNGVSLAFRIG